MRRGGEDPRQDFHMHAAATQHLLLQRGREAFVKFQGLDRILIKGRPRRDVVRTQSSNRLQEIINLRAIRGCRDGVSLLNVAPTLKRTYSCRSTFRQEPS